MDYNFNNLDIQRVIMHTIVPKKGNEPAYAECENEIIDLDEQAELTLKNRLLAAGARRGRAFQLQIEKEGNGTFVDYCTRMKMASDEEFVFYSQRIAELLAGSQGRSNQSGGYLLVVQGVDRETRRSFFIAIKADLHQALIRSQRDGRTAIEALDKIFLSPSQKLFKIGILEELDLDSPRINQKFKCFVFDDQFGTSGVPAAYFISDFLGFSIDGNAQILSQRFFLLSEEFFKNNNRIDSETTDLLIQALTTELTTNQAAAIVPSAFAVQHIADQDVLAQYRTSVETKLPNSFIKDSTLLDGKLKTKKVNFPDDIKISGPNARFNERVKIIRNQQDLENMTANNPNYTIVLIHGHPYSKG